MKALTLFWMLLLIGCLSGCLDGGGGSGGSSAEAKAPATIAPVSPVTPDPVTTDPGSGSTDNGSDPQASNPTDQGTPVTLTYYSLTVTDHPLPSYPSKSVTMTGSCATYQARTFCWDDGTKSFVAASTTFSYDYWGLMTNASHSGGYSTCFGSCAASWLSTPRDVSQNSVASNIQSMSGDTGASVSAVFSSGVQHQESCTELAGVVTCPSVTINL